MELTGKLSPGVYGKDIIITLCGYFNHDEVLNHAVEFVDDGIADLDIDSRLSIANMTTEWGALAGVFPIDQMTISWLGERSGFIARRGQAGVPSDVDCEGINPRLKDQRIDELERNAVAADPGTFYAKDLKLDLGTVRPHVSGPNHVKTMTSVAEMSKRKVKIHKAYLVSCVNSRVEDIARAARVAESERVAEGVEFYITAASNEVQAESEKRGDWQKLVEAGAKVLPPGCGPCIGLGAGLLDDGEVGISATNRNFKGRMGSKEAEVFLASPEVVAASAIAGYIEGPEIVGDAEIKGSIEIYEKRVESAGPIDILEGFPKVIEGELVFCHQDNLNTDGTYPAKYTYMDDFTPEQQAQVVMEDYDPDFGKIVKEGDILIGGFNFGAGSSREQAATSLKYRGISLIVAGSFSETYKRNALNNGFMAIESPELVVDMKKRFGENRLSVKTGIVGRLDFGGSTLTADGKVYIISPIGKTAQELILTGGLESWVRRNLDGQ